MSSETQTAAAAQAGFADTDGIAGKYLTFRLASEEYGVQILKVREIIAVQDITPLPSMPPSMKGVINLRGKIIPVVDLRLKLALAANKFTEHTCIIVTEVQTGHEGEVAHIGCIVDTVNEVLDIAADLIEPPPSLGGNVGVDFLLGLGKIEEKDMVVALLDIDRVLAELDVASFNADVDGTPAESAAAA